MSGRSPNHAEVAVTADPRRVGARLRSLRRGHRPTRGACDECAAARYWMTSVARSSNGCGMARPSVLAVARLIARSNLLGNSMASSPGGVPLNYPVDEPAGPAVDVDQVGTVAHQQPGLGELAEGANAGQAVLQREIGDAPAFREQQAAGCDEKRVRLLLHRGERSRGFSGCVLDSHRIEHVYAECAPRIRQRGSPASAKFFEVEVPEHREATDAGGGHLNSSTAS